MSVKAFTPAHGSFAPTHGGALAEAIRRYGGSAADWIDLSTGINPEPYRLPPIPAAAWARLPDEDLVMAASEAADRFYRGEGGATLQAERMSLPLPLPLPGTQAAIRLLPSFVPAGLRAAIISPTYGEYRRVLKGSGLAADALASLEAVDERHGLVVVVNPNNPDGRRVPRTDLLVLAGDLAARGGLLVVDEAFADFDPAESVARDAGVQPGLLVLRSFGKFFGLAGLRLAFALAEAAILARITVALGPWPVSGPALSIAAAAFSDAEAIDGVRRSIRERANATRALLEAAGLAIAGEAALFFLVRHPGAARIHEALLRRHILVRAFDEQPDRLRFGLVRPGEAARVGAALAGAVKHAEVQD